MVAQGRNERTVDHTEFRPDDTFRRATASDVRIQRQRSGMKSAAVVLRSMISPHATPAMSEWHKNMIRKVIADLESVR